MQGKQTALKITGMATQVFSPNCFIRATEKLTMKSSQVDSRFNVAFISV